MFSAIIKHSADTEPSKIDPRMSPVKFSFKINSETIFTLKHLPLQAFATSTLRNTFGMRTSVKCYLKYILQPILERLVHFRYV